MNYYIITETAQVLLQARGCGSIASYEIGQT